MPIGPLENTREAYSLELELRVRSAVDALLMEGARVSFYAVAARACVARSTLYRCDNLRTVVVNARDYGKPAVSRLAAENIELKLLVSRLEDDLARQRGLYAHRLSREAALCPLYTLLDPTI